MQLTLSPVEWSLGKRNQEQPQGVGMVRFPEANLRKPGSETSRNSSWIPVASTLPTLCTYPFLQPSSPTHALPIFLSLSLLSRNASLNLSTPHDSLWTLPCPLHYHQPLPLTTQPPPDCPVRRSSFFQNVELSTRSRE